MQRFSHRQFPPCGCFLLNGKQTKLRIRKEYLKVQPQIILPVMGLGLAPFVMNITESLINIAFNASLSKYGGDVAVGSDDDPCKYYAVTVHAGAGAWTGRTTAYQL